MWNLRRWKRRRLLRRYSIPDAAWAATVERLPVAHGLTDDELERLRQLCVIFLHEKEIVGAGGMPVSDAVRLTIAAQACLLILNLDMDYYTGWYSVIVYPGQFVPRHEVEDEAGVVHVVDDPLSGESWDVGPVVLSWEDAGSAADGFNVVIHEFAHKLDMLNGAANGMPPLHPGLDAGAWTRDFSAAFQVLSDCLAAGREPPIDPYAAEDPAEFFAVASEAFFTVPVALHAELPAVYRHLQAFYRQDPLARRQAGAAPGA